VPHPFTFFSFRAVSVQYTGIIGIAMMSLGLLLAARPLWLEKSLNGLDKMYRLHKWLGIGGLILSILHWWLAKGTKWMVGWGWLDKPDRHPRPTVELSSWEQWIGSQRGLAETLGEWSFYLAAVLLLLALVQAVPYRLFKKTHTWLAAFYLILVYHSVILMKVSYWSLPVGWLTAGLMLLGTLSALHILFGRVGRKRQVKGIVESLTTYPGIGVVEGWIRLEEGWPGHNPGQFAFVTSSAKEGAHPYTIASCWNKESHSLRFIVKGLGDWTRQLDQWLSKGMQVQVEGPYGCFDFVDPSPSQIWIGAGIGITPFIAGMQALAEKPSDKEIDLFHVTTDEESVALAQLRRDAEAANIRLHIICTRADGRLTPQQIRETVKHWQEASLWFCGPSDFGRLLLQDFHQHGLPKERFHQEIFSLR
jgi:predicted ferric reductase